MKLLSLFLLSLSVKVYAHSSCVGYNSNTVKFFTVKKNVNPRNVLKYAVNINKENCTLSNSSNVVTPFWVMGENNAGDPPCEGLSSLERGYFSVENFRRINAHEAEFTMGLMNKLSSKFPEIKQTVRLHVDRGSQGCEASSLIVVDGALVKVDIADATMTGLFSTNIKKVILTGKQSDGSNYRRVLQD